MTGQKALVTGAGRRLGRAMALALGERGFDVAVHYNRSADDARDVVAALRDMGVRAEALQADLLSEEAMTALVPRAAEALGGPLTLLVNNASIFEPDEIGSATRESWDRHFDSNLRAPFVLTQHFAAMAPEPLRDPSGRPRAQALVVNMIDQRVLKLTPLFMSYTLAKSALWTFTRTAAQALAPKVRVNAIGPGPTLRGARQSEVDFDAQRAATLLERGSDPSDIVSALDYLIRAPAVTGQILCADAGQHLAWRTPDVDGAE
ncbi:SDR family oxidoreductase [Celeribacter indicus]|uniref:Short chain dehydrogenase n=1 Tax=Celeribacter indicus TaxID=1208324 RepID=A0A0B5E7G7_9RHOB|nr:SDR family oxidoreductase [Celeribacter indicus]AJE49011.1 short chain dehydrogenase [Celeribacter indicus]SDW43639.1 NAD(P)-dependent dehydrogenase, short-chain alcohol dehydrogenase family [Celeribacter indicus]